MVGSETALAGKILVADDNMNTLKALRYLLETEGFAVETVPSAEAVLDTLRAYDFNVLVTDLRMPGMDGVELMEMVHKTYPDLPIIILTGHGTIESAVEAVKKGAYDYVEKPWHNRDFIDKIRSAYERQSVSMEIKKLKTQIFEQRGPDAIIYVSNPMKKIMEQVSMVADRDVSVILYGESGTGKELAARAIHYGSPRRDRPFVAVNCASIPETLLENELFGHVKGSYTGANATQKGLFEESDTGTIFLDEIGDISQPMQAKLLRVLQDHEFKKIGGTRPIRVNVRVVSATNQNLRAMVDKGSFRDDLFYRLNVVPITLPPLRERIDDIPLLIDYFRNLFNDELNLKLKGFTREAMEEMMRYPWPGNVRELKNKIKMAMVMTKNSLISPEDLALSDQPQKSVFKCFKDAKEEFEREYLERSLRLAGGNVKKAARLAKRDRSTFYDLLKKYDIDVGKYRESRY
ncbi:sigma-54-dependent transcriptional regulator [Acidobacteriota bacterium]